ncbi:MAG: hypothetical protein J5I52_06045 [Saprospiraceae bacterium]|nr:MAG: hypothetical protein UZ09_BCD002000726 [Bacteroidetes bacterium OLB9]MCO6463694.1 hypothetical protein [Saprospiraceae bacterium]MCZ2337053.1 DUF5683 domain-containing protein [Chitinophagales bacterium]
MSRILPLVIFSIALLYTCKVNGQVDGGLDPFGRPIVIDTSALNENDTIIHKGGFFSLFTGKPGKAALYSLLIPSGGQIYNKKWWKVPLALGIDGSLTYVLIYNRSHYKTAQQNYLTALETGDPRASRYKQQRDFYRKWSEYSWLWLIGGHLITVVDAFVDRHMMEFDISPDLSLYPIQEISNTPTMVINAGIKINLHHNYQKSPNRDFLMP